MSDGGFVVVDIQEEPPFVIDVVVVDEARVVEIITGVGPAGPPGLSGSPGEPGAPGSAGQPGGPAPSVTVITPASAAIVTLAVFGPVFVNTGALSSLVIRLPSSPTLTAFVELSFFSPVASLTVQDSAGAAVTSAPTSAYGPGAAIVFRWVGANWVYWK